MEEAKKLLSQSTTPFDLFKIARKICNVFTYPEISKFTKYTQLFKRGNSIFTKEKSEYPFDNNFCIILYLSGEKSGHWTCVCNNKYGINFLDSYGDVIDDQLYYVNNQINGQNKKYLLTLLSKANKPIYYNDLQLQKMNENIATCGRYCALYLRYDGMKIEDFIDMIKKTSKEYGISPDLLVCILSI